MLGTDRHQARGRLPAHSRIHLFVRRGLSEGWDLRLSDHAEIGYGVLSGLPDRPGVSVGRREVVKQALAVLGLGYDLSQPYRGFHCLHLAEERTDTAELVTAPVLKKTGCLRRDLPLIGIGQGTPCVHMTTDFIDDRSGVVLLRFGRKPLAFVEHKSRLCGGPFLRLW